jgi:hypothetical protein
MTPTSVRTHVGYAAAVVLLGFELCSAQTAVPAVGMADLTKAWRARQSAASTFRFEWSQQRMRWLFPGDIGIRQSKHPTMDTRPGAQASGALRAQLLVDLLNHRVRYAEDGAIWSPEDADYVSAKHDTAFDGTTRKRLYERVGGKHPNGVLDSEPDVTSLADVQVVLLALCPLDSQWSLLTTTNGRIANKPAYADGRRCVVIEETRPDGYVIERWFDAERDYIFARYVRRDLRGRITHQIDCASKKDESYGWIPSGWRDINYDAEGAVIQIKTTTVTAYKIQLPVAAADFTLEFPPKTLVSDYRNRTTHIVRHDGIRRITHPERARRATYEQLLATDEGQAALPATESWGFVLSAAGGVLTLLAAAYWLKRRQSMG